MSENNSNKPDLTNLFVAAVDAVVNTAAKANDAIIANEQNTIEFYLKAREQWLSERILELEKELAAIYASGVVSLILDENDCFHLECALYFKKTDGSWAQTNLRNRSTLLEWSFTPVEQDKLRSQKEIKFNHQK